MTDIDELRDHFLVTYHDSETGYCRLAVSVASGEISGGCGGFPATALAGDDVPEAQRSLLAELREEVVRQQSAASAIRVRYKGRYRRVVLDEVRACDRPTGRAHGYAYTRFELELDEALIAIESARFAAASECSGVFCYWCAPALKWLPLRTAEPRFGMPSPSSPTVVIPDDVRAALLAPLAEPNRPWLPPGD